MAQKTTIEYYDDLDGVTPADQRGISFSLDGVEFEIDLSDANAERLRERLQEFIENARRTGGRRQSPGGTKKTTSRDPEQLQHMRDWGRKHGFTVSDRGRLPGALVDAYDEAHAPKPPEPEKTPAKRSTRKRLAKTS